VAAALCTPDAVQSAEQSCAALAAAAGLSPLAQQDAAVPPEPGAWLMLSPKAPSVQAEQLRLRGASWVAAAPPLVARAQSPLEGRPQRAFRPRAQPRQAALRALELSPPESMAQPENA
jgi:hypothetical protein